jgi:hypothetical protein
MAATQQVKSKLEAFLADKKIDTRRLLATSKTLENLQPEDRAVKLKRLQARKKEGSEKVEAPKGRSGRPISQRTLNAVFGGMLVSGPAKTRILRAVNYLLEKKKAEPTDLKTLFGNNPAGSKSAKKEEKTEE